MDGNVSTPHPMRDEGGFTLVELLVVMLVLALLAAVAISSFFNQSEKARDARAKAAARTAETAMEAYAVDHDGGYSGAGVGELRAYEQTLNGASLAVDLAEANRYQVTAVSATGNSFHITRHPDGTTSLTCETPSTGGCPDDGDGDGLGEWG
jgi:prepilin-type N-terminal cleavage/methylation domain-containing protein